MIMKGARKGRPYKYVGVFIIIRITLGIKIIKASKLHCLALFFLLGVNGFAICNTSFSWPVKIFWLLFVFLFCLYVLLTDVLNARPLPAEFQLLYVKMWRYAMVLKIRDSVNGKKQTRFFSRDQFILMQWKILRRKIRFFH